MFRVFAKCFKYEAATPCNYLCFLSYTCSARMSEVFVVHMWASTKEKMKTCARRYLAGEIRDLYAILRGGLYLYCI